MTEMANEAKGEKSTFYDNPEDYAKKETIQGQVKAPQNHGIHTLYCQPWYSNFILS